jgi:hypothetical protein
MEGLTKENFFNQVEEDLPFAVALFCSWIDEEKIKIDWDEVFNGGWELPQCGGIQTQSPKFHELPFELQFGLISKFIYKYFPLENKFVEFDINRVQVELINRFRLIEQRIRIGTLDKTPNGSSNS